MTEEITLERNIGRGSKDAWALVSRDAFRIRELDPEAFPRHCLVDGPSVRIRISPTSYLHLERLAPGMAVDEVVRAVPFAHVNDRPRVWTTDFALLDGARTPEEVRAWERKNGLRSQAKDVGPLRVPDGPLRTSSVFFDGTDHDVRTHLENVFGTDAFYLLGDEIVLELPLTDKGKRPRPTGETVHVRVRAPSSWSVQAPEGGSWWHVVPEGSDETLCTIAVSNWRTPPRRDDNHSITCPWCRARIIAIEIAAPPGLGPDEVDRPSLHDEIERILQENQAPMTSSEIADAVNAAGRYRRGDGDRVPASQISARTNKHPELFQREGSAIRLHSRQA